MRIAVCSPQVPFSRGGAEILADQLVDELRARGHEADLVTLPFKWYPGATVLTSAFQWRLVDLTEIQEAPIELVIATKFPSYVIRHPNKVVWLVHQFRQAYDLDRTDLGQFGESGFDRALRRRIHELDRTVLGEARRRFAISANVARRLAESLGLDAEVLPPPPQPLDYRCDAYGDFVLSVGRLDRAKRVDLLLAAAQGASFRVVVAGEGPDRDRLQRLAAELRLDGRVEFRGRVAEGDLAELYATCLAVYYAPVDEDFGFVPYEAFLSRKPVVTTRDAGGPLEIVEDGVSGIVSEPDAASVRTALQWLVEHPDDARKRGDAGRERAVAVTWDATIERLLAT